MRNLVIGLLVLLLCTAPASASVLSTAAAGLAVGSWVEVPTTGIQATFTGTIGGTSGNIIEYSDEMTWSTVDKKIYFLGGDHKVNPSATNDWPRFVAYTESTNTWARQPDPFWLVPQMNFHGYDHFAINPATGDLYYRIGNQDFGWGSIYKYTRSAGTWALVPAPPAVGTYGVGFEYVPGYGLIVIANGCCVQRLTEPGMTWTTVNSTLDIGMDAMTEYDPIRQVLLIGGGDYRSPLPINKKFYKMSNTGVVTQMANSPMFLNGSDTQSAPSVSTMDPVSGQMLVLTNTTFYRYNVSTDTWTPITGSVPIRTSGGTTVYWIVATPISDYGVTAWVRCEPNGIDPGGICTMWLYKLTASASDTTPPTVSLTAPANGANVSGTIAVSANASDDSGTVVGVQFLQGVANLGAEDTTSPYSINWDTTTVANGSVTLGASARDAAGNVGTATTRTVTVNNAAPAATAPRLFFVAKPPAGDTIPPTAALTAPADAATVSGNNVTVSATASDNVSVVGVQFLRDGSTPIGMEDTTSPYSIIWDTTTTTDGSHTLSARARDLAGNQFTSPTRSVTVNNGAGGADLTVHTEPSVSIPTAGVPFTEPTFGKTVTRLMDAKLAGYGNLVPQYSQLQVWNSDMTLLLLYPNPNLVPFALIVDATTFQVKHQVDFNWPATGGSLRWDPVNPLRLYYLGGLDQTPDPDGIACGTNAGRLMRYTLSVGPPMTATRSLVHCFTEYPNFKMSESWEELSDNGQYIAIIGVTSGGVEQVFAYDIVNNIKSPTINVPAQGADWAAMSPTGNYVLVQWGGGAPNRFFGLESFTRSTMAYAGKVNTTLAHSDAAIDESGQEWVVFSNAANAYMLTEAHYIVKAKIPQGVIITGGNTVDEAATLSGGWSVPLVVVDWFHNMHISCRNIQAGGRGWCAFGTYSIQEGVDNGWQWGEDEVVKLYLDSTVATPHLTRLAHHHSQIIPYTSNGCPGIGQVYYAQPHATVSPNGTKVIYGSNWRRICDATEPIDPYIVIP